MLIDPTIDAGLFTPLAVGNYVWVDTNANGVQDGSEWPLPNVTVEIMNPDHTAVIDANGNPVAPTRTNGVGWYLFDNLLPGDYVIRFTSVPSGAVFTTQAAVGAGVGSDSNPNSLGETPTFTLSATGPNVRTPVAADNTDHLIDPTIDAGVVLPASGALPSTGSAILDTLLYGGFLVGVGYLLLLAVRRRKGLAA